MIKNTFDFKKYLNPSLFIRYLFFPITLILILLAIIFFSFFFFFLLLPLILVFLILSARKKRYFHNVHEEKFKYSDEKVTIIDADYKINKIKKP